MIDKKNSRPIIGVGVLVWREKKILLGQRITDASSSMCWQFPGGHLEADESVLACAQREVREETGLEIKNLRHLGFTNKSFVAGEKKYITLLVSCDYSSGEAQVLEADKCADWQWFDYRELPSPLFEPINLFLSQQQTNREKFDLYALHCASFRDSLD
ncbi:MAG: NUDIX domain-containing protein [Gammaproteobacteria bacterium]|nr:NUDIX domain-containing protein [Gammaproteobacteria bacterium]